MNAMNSVAPVSQRMNAPMNRLASFRRCHRATRCSTVSLRKLIFMRHSFLILQSGESSVEFLGVILERIEFVGEPIEDSVIALDAGPEQAGGGEDFTDRLGQPVEDTMQVGEDVVVPRVGHAMTRVTPVSMYALSIHPLLSARALITALIASLAST